MQKSKVKNQKFRLDQRFEVKTSNQKVDGKKIVKQFFIKFNSFLFYYQLTFI